MKKTGVSLQVTRAQYVLLGCMFLGLFTEVLLSPFYPQFFRKVFGIEDYAYTGFYIFVCRLTVVLCSPLWGFLSRRFDPKYLLFVGQAGTAVLTALMATASSAGQFLAITVVLLFFKSSYMLIYPLIVRLGGGRNNAATAATVHAVYHTAIILSTLAGAWMMDLHRPLAVFYIAALADAVQLAFCVWALREAGEEGTGAVEKSESAGRWNPFLLVLGLLFFTITVAHHMTRPFFTRYTEQVFDVTIDTASFLFLIPSLMAVAAMPLIRRLCVPERLKSVGVSGGVAMVAGLYLQGTAESAALLVVGRMVYGVFLAITMAALDVIMFNRESGQRLPFHFSVIVSFQTVGELISPLLASALVEAAGLAAPLTAAAAICLVNVLLFLFFMKQQGTAIQAPVESGTSMQEES
ncbi:MAG: MFS transporter [Brevibacillus sp.]|nr:MFS transporter [Brevibacillus sp.]